MDKLFIEKTDNSPEVILDCNANIYHVIGESRPENVRKFYEPVFNWFQLFFDKQYVLNNTKEIKIKFFLEYFNSTSAKIIFDLFNYFKQQQVSYSFNIIILWEYDQEDIDMLEAGKELERLTQLKFEYIISA